MSQLTIPGGSITGNTLILGIQTNAGLVQKDVLFKVAAWSPPKAQSYKVLWLKHTDYHGRAADHETGYATFEVAYFSRLDEGEPIPPKTTKPLE